MCTTIIGVRELANVNVLHCRKTIIYYTWLLGSPSNSIKKDTLAQIFSCKFYEIFKNTFKNFLITPLVAASVIFQQPSKGYLFLSLYVSFLFIFSSQTSHDNIFFSDESVFAFSWKYGNVCFFKIRRKGNISTFDTIQN